MADSLRGTDGSIYDPKPVFRVKGAVQQALSNALLSLEISDDWQGMGRLEARFENWSASPQGSAPGYMFFDGGVATFGDRFEVEVKTTGDKQTVFSGRVTALGAQFGTRWVPEFTLCAEDDLQLLRMTRRTATYEDTTDASVAARLARAHNLQADADAPGPQHKVLVQLNQTDLGFLRDRARAIDAQIYYEGGQVKFKARASRGGAAVELHRDDLVFVNFHADLAHQVTEVHGHAYDVASKIDVDQRASSSALAAEAKGARTGAAIMQEVFGQRIEHLHDTGMLSAEEARAAATAELLERGRSFVRCRAETMGTPDLRVGTRVRLSGLGTIFSGTYTVTQLTHRYDKIDGLRTLFVADRPAIGKESA